MLVKSFVSNIIIDAIINNYTIWISIHRVKLFEVGCLHQYTVTALYRLDRNEKLLEIFMYPSINSAS